MTRQPARSGILLRSFLKLSAQSALCEITSRSHRLPFRFDRLDFGDQVVTGDNENSKRWQIEKYRVGHVEYLPEQISTSKPILQPAMDLTAFVRYVGPEIDGEFFAAQASGELVL